MIKKALKSAFPLTIPVMLGYLSIGVAFGLLLENAGYSFVWSIFMSLTVYSGAMQFIAVNFLVTPLSILEIAIVTLVVNIRHMFYGLSFLDRFQIMGRLKGYLIFALTDETYSLLCSTKTPDGVNEKHFLFFIAFLNQCYWVMGSAVGAIAGSFITFDTTGMDFAMTALFLVIFADQWKTFATHIPALLGLGCTVASLVIFGADNLVLPAMLAVTALLLALKKPIESKLPGKDNAQSDNIQSAEEVKDR